MTWKVLMHLIINLIYLNWKCSPKFSFRSPSLPLLQTQNSSRVKPSLLLPHKRAPPLCAAVVVFLVEEEWLEEGTVKGAQVAQSISKLWAAEDTAAEITAAGSGLEPKQTPSPEPKPPPKYSGEDLVPSEWDAQPSRLTENPWNPSPMPTKELYLYAKPFLGTLRSSLSSLSECSD